MKPHESGVESETAMERRKRAEAELTLSALADLMEEQVALMNAENVRLREELAGVKTALGPDYAAWNTTISAAQNVATMRMMLESAEAKLEVAQEGTSAAELLVGPGLCSAQDCGGHCGYVHAVGCEAIREYLADHGGEPYRAPPRAGQAGGEVEMRAERTGAWARLGGPAHPGQSLADAIEEALDLAAAHETAAYQTEAKLDTLKAEVERLRAALHVREYNALKEGGE